MKKHKFIHSLAVVYCILALLCLMPLSMVQAEENTSDIMPLWFEEDVNLLNSTQQQYVCENWDFINSFDTIWFFTDSGGLILGNYTNTESSGYVVFSPCYVLNSSGELIEQSIPRKWKDDGNYGAVYKSTGGAFNFNINNMNVLNNCIVDIPPNLDLPTPNEPNITTNTEQSSYIGSVSSPVVSGGVINYFRYDFFNIYAVNSTAYDNSLGGSSDLTIKYKQDSTGRYIIPIYDHSEVVIYGPNITISTSGLQITPSLYSGVSYSYPNSNGIIQRDVNRFDYTYVDLQMLNQYPYESLPFSNSNTNTGKVEYLGTQTSVRSGGTGSKSIMLEFNGKNYSTTFYIVITDSFKDIEQAKQETNQTTINTNVNNNFTNLDNQLKDMANTNDNGQFNQLGNELITNVESKATSLFYPVTWAIDTLNNMTNVEEKAVITLPALFKTNETYDIDFSVVENELPELFIFIRSIIWIALAMLCINGVQNIIGGGINDN